MTSAYAVQRILDRTGKPVTVLAHEAGVDAGGLSRVLNARNGARLTERMLEKLLALGYVSGDEKMELVLAFIEDSLPCPAKGLVLVLRKPTDDKATVAEEPVPYGDDILTQAMATLVGKARANPALARMLRNLAQVSEGKIEPVV